jgi:hypothetical protein
LKNLIVTCNIKEDILVFSFENILKNIFFLLISIATVLIILFRSMNEITNIPEDILFSVIRCALDGANDKDKVDIAKDFQIFQKQNFFQKKNPYYY